MQVKGNFFALKQGRTTIHSLYKYLWILTWHQEVVGSGYPTMSNRSKQPTKNSCYHWKTEERINLKVFSFYQEKSESNVGVVDRSQTIGL
jgi:hypothetical protein